MKFYLELPERTEERVDLGDQFTRRLEASLRSADQERRRRLVLRRARQALILLLLATPIVAWSLMLATPHGLHVAIDSLAWLTFLLDVGVHADNAVLSYVGLQAVPTIVGALLLVLVTGWLLSPPRNDL